MKVDVARRRRSRVVPRGLVPSPLAYVLPGAEGLLFFFRWLFAPRFFAKREGMSVSAVELSAAAARRREQELRMRQQQRTDQPRRMLGAQALIECLKAEGVEYIFGHPGGAVLHLYDALYGSGLNTVLCRHEQAAADMADGYARGRRVARVFVWPRRVPVRPTSSPD